MKKVIIFGHAGFSGSFLIDYLLTNIQDIKIIGVDKNKSKVPITEYQNDITDFNQVNTIIQKILPDYIVNLAGINYSDDPLLIYKTNVFPVINIINSLNQRQLYNTILLLISSSAIYGNTNINPISENTVPNPVNLYGLSKLAMEQLIPVLNLNNKCKIIIARTFNILGPGLPKKFSVSSFISQLINIQKSNQKPSLIKTGNLTPHRDYIDVRDAVKAYWTIITKGIPGEIYNIGSGKSIEMKKILDIIIEQLDINVKIETDISLVRKNEIMYSLADITKIRKLGWNPEIELNTSISDMIKYYSQQAN